MNTMTHENKLYHTRRGNERARGPDNRGSTGAQSRARGARAGPALRLRQLPLALHQLQPRILQLRLQHLLGALHLLPAASDNSLSEVDQHREVPRITRMLDQLSD